MLKQLGVDAPSRGYTALILISYFLSVNFIFGSNAVYILALSSLISTSYEFLTYFPRNMANQFFYVYCILVHFISLWTPRLTTIIIITQVSDLVQLVFGRWAKGNRNIITISPNKTIEGYLGALVAWFFFYLWGCQQVMLIILSGILGDLYVSYVKRHNNMKDCSTLLGSHGGWLDRIDSTMLAVLVIYLT